MGWAWYLKSDDVRLPLADGWVPIKRGDGSGVCRNVVLGVALATIRKWERGIGEPSGAAKTLLAVARLHPDAIREALAAGK